MIDIAERQQYTESHESLVANIDEMLAIARPRLLRQVCSHGVTADAADDIVQETLLEAWRHLSQLRSPDRFESWLHGICSNVCRRWSRTQGRTVQHQVPFSSLRSDERYSDDERLDTLALADESAFDPAEELSRQDLTILLDRALGHLTPDTRKAVEMCYLAELPQREAAQRLGLTINTLEVRLHRARRQLLQVLNGELRAEAEDFGLLVNPKEQLEWRETRIWCIFCARHHFQGMLETMHDGRVSIHLRCPDCTNVGPREWIFSGGLFELRGLKSFRPAWNRAQQIAVNYWTATRKRKTCFYCQAPVKMWLAEPGQWIGNIIRPWQGYRFVIYCPACDSLNTFYAGGIVWQHPLTQRFIQEHPRWIHEPEVLTDYSGLPALRVTFADVTGTAHLTFLLHAETLHVLTTFQE